MTRTLRLLADSADRWVRGLSWTSFAGSPQGAYAQDTSRSSRSDGESRESRRDRYRAADLTAIDVAAIAAAASGRDRARRTTQRRAIQQRSGIDKQFEQSRAALPSAIHRRPSTHSLRAAPASSRRPDSRMNMKDTRTSLVKQRQEWRHDAPARERKELRGPPPIRT